MNNDTHQVVGMNGKDVVIADTVNELEYKPEDKGYVLIADSYNATMATVGGDGYEEYCLYQKDDIYEIHHYKKYEYTSYVHEAYLTDINCKNELIEFFKKEKIANYEGKISQCMAGGRLVMKLKKDEKMIGVSSDNVPYDKHYLFHDFRNLILKYIDTNKRIF